jgi:hypothetical protein
VMSGIKKVVPFLLCGDEPFLLLVSWGMVLVGCLLLGDSVELLVCCLCVYDFSSCFLLYCLLILWDHHKVKPNTIFLGEPRCSEIKWAQFIFLSRNAKPIWVSRNPTRLKPEASRYWFEWWLLQPAGRAKDATIHSDRTYAYSTARYSMALPPKAKLKWLFSEMKVYGTRMRTSIISVLATQPVVGAKTRRFIPIAPYATLPVQYGFYPGAASDRLRVMRIYRGENAIARSLSTTLDTISDMTQTSSPFTRTFSLLGCYGCCWVAALHYFCWWLLLLLLLFWRRRKMGGGRSMRVEKLTPSYCTVPWSEFPEPDPSGFTSGTQAV